MTDGGTVRAVAASIEHDTFAANRARGTIALAVAAADGVTRRTRVHESGSLRVRFPNTQDGLEAVIVNTGGGMTGGDEFSVGIDVAEGAHLVAGTAAAEKIYRSTGPDTAMNVRLSVGEGGRLAWLPQETILFDRARLKRRIGVDLAEDASLVMAEAIVFGRAAMGEQMTQGFWADTWRVRRGGRLAFAENVRLDGDITAKLARRACANGAIALATVLIAPADDRMLEAVRALDFAGEAGVSAWNGIAVARLVARDGASLRRDLVALLAGLGQPVPRLWHQ
ncbi:MAG TPA: urease accessory protein UreD [Pseudolabrys sp.]|jgi:urease accessory protein|nr:urease accessory protein UreD [Pseudolabrys sp.]